MCTTQVVTLTIPLTWFRGKSDSPESQRRALLRRTIRLAAGHTRYGRDYETGPASFESLPVVDLLEFLRHPERYTVSGAKSQKEALLYPLESMPRTAVVGRAVAESRRVQCFSSLQDERLADFAPQSIAAPLDALRAAVGLPLRHAPLRNAVVAFTGILEGPLTAEDADRLWRVYQVPVFEQFLGLDGELLAWECEIHHGLHVREEAAYFEVGEGNRILVSFLANPRLPVLRLETGLLGRLVPDACPCGDRSPRLADLRRRIVRRPVSAIAMAAAAVS